MKAHVYTWLKKSFSFAGNEKDMHFWHMDGQRLSSSSLYIAGLRTDCEIQVTLYADKPQMRLANKIVDHLMSSQLVVDEDSTQLP